MADDEQFSLCWNNFNSNLSAGFHESLCRGDLVDVTLAAEGQFVKAHRLVLSVCSPYFRKMFTQMPANQHAFVFLKDVSHTALKDLIQFMYCGEVNVKQEALPAFISTAEALQIKGLTDSDPPPPQSPVKPSTPAPQPPPIQQMPSPRVRQRTSTSRSYKIETIDDSGDDNRQATQIVIQTTTPPQQAQTAIVQQTQHQPHHHQQTQQHNQPQQTTNTIATATTTGITQKRPAQRSISSTPHTKRTKSTIDPLDATESTVVAPSSQQITVQTVVAESKTAQQQQSEPEFIDLPIELPTKSEPDYAEDAGDVETAEQETTYVEDDSYGEMRYDESYFTENEDAANAAATGGVSGNISGAGATTSKTIVKQQAFSDSSFAEASDQTNNEAQGPKLMFIESPWATPCLILNNYMYNCHSKKNNKEYWRCHNYSKKQQADRCRSRCVLENGKLKNCTGGSHNHLPHSEKIEKMLTRNRMVSQTSGSSSGISRLKFRRRTIPLGIQVQQRHHQMQRIQQPQQTEEIIHSSIMLLDD